MEVKTVWWYKVQGGGHERMERKCIAAGETQVNSLSDFSWTYLWHWHDGLVALTPNVDGVMWPWWCDRWMKQPNSTWMRSESVMFSPSPPLFIGRSFTSICLFTPFEEQLRRVILSAILVTLPWLENSKPYLESAATQFYHSFLKKWVSFKLFLINS